MRVSSSLAQTMQGFARGQVVFVVMSSRKKNAQPLALAIGKDNMERLARRYRNGAEPARFPTACLRKARVASEGEIDLIETPKPAPIVPGPDPDTDALVRFAGGEV